MPDVNRARFYGAYKFISLEASVYDRAVRASIANEVGRRRRRHRREPRRDIQLYEASQRSRYLAGEK